MDEFRNTLLKNQLDRILSEVVESPDAIIRKLLKKKNGWDVDEIGNITFKNRAIGELLSTEICKGGHIHAKVKMYYEFIVPMEDTDESKGPRH